MLEIAISILSRNEKSIERHRPRTARAGLSSSCCSTRARARSASRIAVARRRCRATPENMHRPWCSCSKSMLTTMPPPLLRRLTSKTVGQNWLQSEFEIIFRIQIRRRGEGLGGSVNIELTLFYLSAITSSPCPSHQSFDMRPAFTSSSQGSFIPSEWQNSECSERGAGQKTGIQTSAWPDPELSRCTGCTNRKMRSRRIQSKTTPRRSGFLGKAEP